MKNLLSALALLLAANASAQTKPWLEGQHSGVKQPMAVAIQDSRTWDEIWRRHDARSPVPEVDFTKQSVVAVFLGLTETAGVKVRVVVQQDALDSSRINVFYRRTETRNGFAAQVQCEPYAMVKVPRAATIDIEQDVAVGVPESAKPPATPKLDGEKLHALIEGLANPAFDEN